MGKFGWSYPPGCSGTPFDDEPPCEVCSYPADSCICPECPVCGEVGNPTCYRDVPKPYTTPNHNLELNFDQKIGRAKADIDGIKDQLATAEQYLAWLEDQNRKP